jgi:MFS family permease
MPAQRTERLRRRDFPLFWAGETVSLVGTQITLLALPLTAVLVLHATPQQLGLIRFLEQAPYVVCALFLGAWVDRRRRKGVLILANAARSVLLGLVPLLALLGRLQLSLLAALACAVGVFAVLFDVSWVAYVPTLVARDRLIAANGKLAASASAAEVAGPGLGGVLVQVFSAPLALAFDAASYAVATITLLLIRTPEPAPQRGQQAHLLREIGAGIRVVARNAYLRAAMLMSGLWNLLAGIASTAFLLYAVRERGLSPGALGTIFAVGAAGGLLGAAISTRLGRRGHFGPTLGVAFAFGCLPWILLPALAEAPRFELGGYMIAYFLIQVGLGLWAVLTRSLFQAITPVHLMGRVSATVRLVSYGLGAVGLLLSGVLATVLGLRPTLWLAAVGFVIILVITWVATPLPRVRSLPEMVTATAE